MTKKHFIELADTIKEHNRVNKLDENRFNQVHIQALARFCYTQNSNFNRVK